MPSRFVVSSNYLSRTHFVMTGNHQDSKGGCTVLEPTILSTEESNLVSDDLPSSSSKRLKLTNPNPVNRNTMPVGKVPEFGGSHEYEPERSSGAVQVFHNNNSDVPDCPLGATNNKVQDVVREEGKDITELPQRRADNAMGKPIAASHGRSNWKPFEKDLYLKGLEIFGRNR